MNDRLVWIDCEMTGLLVESDALVEVAALVTDFELNVLGEGLDVIIKPPDAALEQMVPLPRLLLDQRITRLKCEYVPCTFCAPPVERLQSR